MYQAQEVCFISYTSLFRPAVLVRFPHITAIVSRAKDTEILYFRRLLMTMFEVLIAEQSLSNSELWTFPGSHVDVSGSHSKEQFCEWRRFTGGSFPLKHVLSFSEKTPVCYKSCLLTIFVLHEICATRTPGKGFAGAHTWSHPAEKPWDLPCWQMAPGDNSQK